MDSQSIVDFRLKAWVSRFITLRGKLYEDEDDGPSREYKGEMSSLVGVTGLHSLEKATQRILARLYAGFSLPDHPVTKKHVSKAERNADIIARHNAGESLSELAREYGISPQRAHQIVTGKSN